MQYTFAGVDYGQITSVRAKENQISLIQIKSPRILGCTYSPDTKNLTYDINRQANTSAMIPNKIKDNYMDGPV